VTQVPAGTSVWLQVVSLFPPTYRNRPNGLRPDLVKLVQATGPKIFRFPGGNYVEGVTVDTRWNWKQTIGPVWERPGHQNSAWGYWSDDGLGLLEYLQLAEDLGAAPVMAVWAGLALNGTVVAQGDLGPYVQDALDQIEYAIGPVTSTWGARRAADGHPKPFAVPAQLRRAQRPGGERRGARQPRPAGRQHAGGPGRCGAGPHYAARRQGRLHLPGACQLADRG
jgi:alpha-L-arabinofuranosidase